MQKSLWRALKENLIFNFSRYFANSFSNLFQQCFVFLHYFIDFNSLISFLTHFSHFTINRSNQKSSICLPKKKDPLPEDMTCYISGWGNINKNGYPTAPLQHGPVLRIPRNICNLPGNKNGKVGTNELCAGYLTDGNFFCEGDTGASMVCQPKDKSRV